MVWTVITLTILEVGHAGLTGLDTAQTGLKKLHLIYCSNKQITIKTCIKEYIRSHGIFTILSAAETQSSTSWVYIDL